MLENNYSPQQEEAIQKVQGIVQTLQEIEKLVKTNTKQTSKKIIFLKK